MKFEQQLVSTMEENNYSIIDSIFLLNEYFVLGPQILDNLSLPSLLNHDRGITRSLNQARS